MKWDRTKGRPEPIRLLNLIPERESGEPLVELAEYAPSVKVLRPTVLPWVRKTVALMAEEAAHRLPVGLHLGIVDAWRPFERQQKIYDGMCRFLLEAKPDISHVALRRTICRWVAPTDQKAPPGHTTGAAIDVNLVNEAGEPVDVTSPFPRLTSAPTYVMGLTPEAHENRMNLVEAMLSVGFSNCRDEWWHYSYGDAGWAVRLGHPECFYGRIDLEPSLYAEQEREWEEAFRHRANPFLASPDQPSEEPPATPTEGEDLPD